MYTGDHQLGTAGRQTQQHARGEHEEENGNKKTHVKFHGTFILVTKKIL
jgi:hypothetical protein